LNLAFCGSFSTSGAIFFSKNFFIMFSFKSIIITSPTPFSKSSQLAKVSFSIIQLLS